MDRSVLIEREHDVQMLSVSDWRINLVCKLAFSVSAINSSARCGFFAGFVSKYAPEGKRLIVGYWYHPYLCLTVILPGVYCQVRF